MSPPAESPAYPEGTSSEGRDLAAHIKQRWRALGVDGSFLARHLGTGEWLGFDTAAVYPLASVIKVPIALAALHLFETGDLDPAAVQHFLPPSSPSGPTGLAVFSGPATMITADLVYLMLALSDNVAADRLVELIGLPRLRRLLEDWRLGEIRVRHPMLDLYQSAVGSAGEDFRLALELAIGGGLADGAHRLSTLDVRTANVANAAVLAQLLERIWTDDIVEQAATSRLRQLMGRQVSTGRLAVELRSDSVTISGKTGSFLNLRHEIGVAESDTGDVVVLVALTRSAVPAFTQPRVDDAIGAAARDSIDLLREQAWS